MDGAVPLALRPGDQAVLDVVVHHGWGEGGTAVKTNQLPGHVGDQLIHIQRDIGQVVPEDGPFLLHAGFQLLKLIHSKAFLL